MGGKIEFNFQRPADGGRRKRAYGGQTVHITWPEDWGHETGGCVRVCERADCVGELIDVHCDRKSLRKPVWPSEQWERG